MDQHAVDERFVLLEPVRMQRIPLGSAQVGAVMRVTPGGMADDGSTAVEHFVRGDAMRPPSPVHVRASLDSDGNLNCRWVRRSRLGWEWLDQVDAPLGCAAENYRVSLQSAVGRVDIETATSEAQFTAAQVAAIGATGVELSVIQIGDFAASYPSLLSLTFNQE